ncbi:MAG: alanine racemase [Coriobacteriia bacterium]
MEYPRFAQVDIDLGAVRANVGALKGLTARGTSFMAVVKADAYGHGAVPVARAALEAGADRLGVATIEEAVQLRAAGVTAVVQLLSEPPVQAIPLVLEHGIVTTVATRDFAVELGRQAAATGAQALFHLKVDTGMNRIGVCAEDARELVGSLAGFPGLVHEGTFTHFATADVPGDWDFDRQLKRFTSTLIALRDEGIDPGIVHAANSAATILHPESHFHMVRCGIAIYGLHPASSTYESVALSPAMSVKARASFVKRIGIGDGVSYGLTWHAAAPTTIVTLPLGYADGLHRVLSNTMEVLLGGVRCAQVGRICMDQFMVEAPRGLTVRLGDEAVIVGSQGIETISMDAVASAAGTINYEMACSFGMRMPRVYI